MTIALIAGDTQERIAVLADAAVRMFGSSVQLCAFEVSRTSVDPGLAWGTKEAVVQPLGEPPSPSRPPGPPATTDRDRRGATQLPLTEVGDSAVAIIDAARGVQADVIVVAADHSGWLSRLYAGSATTDLIRTASLPVLVVDARHDGEP